MEGDQDGEDKIGKTKIKKKQGGKEAGENNDGKRKIHANILRIGL